MINCKKCNGKISKYGFQNSKNGRVQRFQCQDCGSITLEPKNIPKDIEQHKPTNNPANQIVVDVERIEPKQPKPKKISDIKKSTNIPTNGATILINDFSELIDKVKLDELMDSVLIVCDDDRMIVRAIGIEDKEGIIDNTLTIDVNYPCHCQEYMELGIPNLGKLKSNLKIFEKNDNINISIDEDFIKIYCVDNPTSQLKFESMNKKLIKTNCVGLKVIFGTPIKIVRSDGKEKFFAFDSSATIDASKLIKFQSTIKNMGDVRSIPISIKDGKFTSNIRNDDGFEFDHGFDSNLISGTATEIYPTELLSIFKYGFGVATLKFSKGSPIHIEFRDDIKSAHYLLQAWDGR